MLRKSMEWFLYDNSHRHERVKNWFLYDNGLRHERVKNIASLKSKPVN